ncbi:hypothetical protein M9434_004847 [Picochlorum sp. BPE23]|nr:hypothetical protein M9434_004847 [Picochlorum sp. BPE23]
MQEDMGRATTFGTWFRKFKWIQSSREQTLRAESRLLALSGCELPLKQKDTFIHNGKDFLHSIEGGKADGPPLVYLPGYGAGVGFFFRIIKGLCAGWHVYCVDLLGTGLSSRPKFSAKSTEEAENFFIDSLEEWRKARQLDTFILVGHSMGGYLAGCYARKHPDRVRHLVMVCPAGIGEKPKDWSPPDVVKSPWTMRGQLYRLATRLWNSGVTPGVFVRGIGPWGPKMVSGYTSRRFSVGHHLSDDEIDAFSEYMYGILSAKGSGEYALRHILEPFAYPRSPLEYRLDTIKVPISFIYGKQDWMDPKAAQRLIQRIQNNREKILEGDMDLNTTENAGHFPFLDQPGEFLRGMVSVCGSHLSEKGIRSVLEAADEFPLEDSSAIDTKSQMQKEMKSNPAAAEAHIATDL